MKIEGFTREPTHFQEIEKRLRIEDRTVSSDPKPNDLKRDKYIYGFAELVKIPPLNRSETGGTARPSGSSATAGATSASGAPAKVPQKG